MECGTEAGWRVLTQVIHVHLLRLRFPIRSQLAVLRRHFDLSTRTTFLPLPLNLLAELSANRVAPARYLGEERVAHDLLGERPPLHVLNQTLRYESAQLGREGVGLGELWRRIAGDLEKGAHRVDVGERRVALGQLDGRDADGPDVAPRVVRLVQLLLAGDHLRRHPVRSADAGVAPGQRRRQVRAHAEVDQLHVALFGQQDVVTLDVAVHAVVLVQEDQRLQRLVQNVDDLVLGHPRAPNAQPLNQVGHRAARAQLQSTEK